MLEQHEWVICPRCNGKFLKGAEKSWKDGYCFHCHSPLVRINNLEFRNNPIADGPHGWIQWKGTDICMDINLPCCDGHIDGDFAYFVKCLCGKYWALDGHVKMIEATEPQEIEEIKTCPSLIVMEEDPWDNDD